MTELSDRLLNSREVENILGVGPGWCAKDRISAARIPHIKIGKSCRYRMADVQAFIASSVKISTTDTGSEAG